MFLIVSSYFHDVSNISQSKAGGLATWGHLCPATCLASGYPGSDCWTLGFHDAKAYREVRRIEDGENM